ncbi:LysM domain-containing protein [Actinomycetospora cinnamomea]|uniref:LysM domain-containing protein n=1 Tax=Actinomycetospora cinnamomea TaxID=663609 RepID=A0A2U1F7S5_9PSEU|nr:LysM domain-containing protein [Actinomycetospora cinnamomea]PVZ08199.1 hypothetical protein C8D89_10982 [Actinomycetospora cinnamomea]
MFEPTSRYAAVETTETVVAGRPVSHLRRRVVPAPEDLAAVGEHEVEPGDRLDNVTAAHLGDPELFWRLADGNRALRPDELTETVGRRLRITLPEGFAGGASDVR